MLVGNIKVVEDEVRWRRSKGVVMNSFYLSRNSEGVMRDNTLNYTVTLNTSLTRPAHTLPSHLATPFRLQH